MLSWILPMRRRLRRLLDRMIRDKEGTGFAYWLLEEQTLRPWREEVLKVLIWRAEWKATARGAKELGVTYVKHLASEGYKYSGIKRNPIIKELG